VGGNLVNQWSFGVEISTNVGFDFFKVLTVGLKDFFHGKRGWNNLRVPIRHPGILGEGLVIVKVESGYPSFEGVGNDG